MTKARILLALLAGCSQVEEELVLVLPPSLDADNVEELVVTVLDPIIIDEAGEASFVACEALGRFDAVRRLDAGADYPDNPAILEQVLASARGGRAELSVRPPSPTTDNPWGAVAVLAEARAVVTGDRVTERGTVLSACVCLRTEVARHPDPDLQAEVQAACPLAGGVDGEPAQERSLELAPTVPPAFVLEPCGQGLGALRASGVSDGSAPVCLRARLCDNAPPGTECFDCPSPCPSASLLGGGAISFTTDSDAVEPREQVSLTDEDGRAWPTLITDQCEPGTTVSLDARVVGRPGPATAVRLRCLEGGGLQEVATSTGALSSPARRAEGGFAAISEEGRLTMFERQGAQLIAGPSVPLRLGAFVAGLVELDGRWAVAKFERASGLVVSQVEGQVETAVAPCEDCACAPSGESCSPTQPCAEGDTCSAGQCVCSCRHNSDPSEARLMVADMNGDGFDDLVLGGPADPHLTSYFGGPDGLRSGACRCARTFPWTPNYLVSDLGVGAAADVVVVNGGRVFVQYGSETTSCDAAVEVQPARVAAAVAAGPFSGPDAKGLVLFELDDRFFGRLQVRTLFGAAGPLVDDPSVIRAPGRSELSRVTRARINIDFVEAGDFNGDARADLVVASIRPDTPLLSSVEVLAGSGDGAFVRLSSIRLPCSGEADLAVVDTDRDGRDEILVACRFEPAKLLELR